MPTTEPRFPAEVWTRLRNWALLLAAGLASWALLGAATWLVVGWITS